MEWTKNPAFGIALTIAVFRTAQDIHRRHPKAKILKILNPLVLAMFLGILVLYTSGIPLANYNIGADYLNFFLGPVVVTLALPLYRNQATIKKHLIPILVAITCAALVSLVSVIVLSRLLGLPDPIMRSLLGKSTTTPIAMEIARIFTGNPSIAILGVILTGNLGVMVSGFIFRHTKVTDPVAIGIALGSSSHAIGTVTALSSGRRQGALASLAMGLCGLISVLLTPLISLLFHL